MNAPISAPAASTISRVNGQLMPCAVSWATIVAETIIVPAIERSKSPARRGIVAASAKSMTTAPELTIVLKFPAVGNVWGREKEKTTIRMTSATGIPYRDATSSTDSARELRSRPTPWGAALSGSTGEEDGAPFGVSSSEVLPPRSPGSVTQSLPTGAQTATCS